MIPPSGQPTRPTPLRATLPLLAMMATQTQSWSSLPLTCVLPGQLAQMLACCNKINDNLIVMGMPAQLKGVCLLLRPPLICLAPAL